MVTGSAHRQGSEPVSRLRLKELVADRGEDLPLDQGAALLAAEEDPSLDPAAPLARLDEMARAIGRRDENNLFLAVARINHHLFHELGFEGDTEGYDEPYNSFVDKVIKRRKGLPILMSVIYMELGRRIGVPIDGIGFPGHFVVSPRNSEPRFFIDPFHNGRILKEADMRGLLRRFSGAWEVEPETWTRFISPVSHASILTRINNNLKRSWGRRGNLEGALRASERNLVLDPHSIVEHHDRATILAELGRTGEAVATLERYIAAAPSDQELSPLCTLLERLRQKP